MMRVKWCRQCGRLSAFNFAFCPWCGFEFAEKPDLEGSVDRAFERIERIERGLGAGSRNRMDDIERRLAELDRDLGDFLGGTGEGEFDGHEALPLSDHLSSGP
jgi:hypothetical protein